MMKFVNTGIGASRFEADKVAKDFNGGRLPKHAELDRYKMEGNRGGSFWAKEWAARDVYVERGKDVVDKNTFALILYSDIEKADKLLRESDRPGLIGIRDGCFLIRPEAYTFKNGLYVFENPSFIAIHNMENYRGMADIETKIAVKTDERVLDSLESTQYDQIRCNYINSGVWPLFRSELNKAGDWANVRNIYGNALPFVEYGVLSVISEKMTSENEVI